MRYLRTVAGAAMIAMLPAWVQAATIHVTGTGTVVAEPDMAVITLGVSEENREASGAIRALAASPSWLWPFFPLAPLRPERRMCDTLGERDPPWPRRRSTSIRNRDR